ncbi:RimJ/RimL family protein N-acetyltransferase [Catenuloplanes nepalensis]|uniref:RimJ/RimL family protein N-acetyltransferase n=1 Tax=Catenuloplanes nepalensis TaxID=587533 RepID=A0ABT9MRK1_9ACTN|nr:GNAT family protein [Catenuloplanes nepalensis]MDP9794051.1 RimJ/RimL family protein N-acetyltransferase [Catenuloplanes nepalensis]
MTVLRTDRLTLHPVDTGEGERIAARAPADTDSWAADFPFDGDVFAVTAFLRATAEHGEQRPFGYYRITRTSDGLAIGGIGFKGRPRDGRAEVGYGLAPAARGHGYAAEALAALVTVAADHGLTHVAADTDAGNIASRRTLERAGFTRVGPDHRYELALA